MKRTHRVALAAGAAILALTPASATHSWGGYHWATNGSGLSLKVNTAVTADWASYVGTAITDWDSSRILALTSQTAAVNAKTCNPILGQALVCNAIYGQRGWLGIASIWLSNGHIVQATTKLNDSYYYAHSFYDTPAWRAVAACQEIGHDFGLDHQDENFSNVNLGTCMDYTSNPAGGVYNGFDYGPSNEHPNKHDYDELKIIYSHDDGYTSATASMNFGIREVGQSPISSAGSGNSPAEWGRAIHRDAQGRPDVFEKALAPGQKVLTHVFWAIGERAR